MLLHIYGRITVSGPVSLLLSGHWPDAALVTRLPLRFWFCGWRRRLIWQKKIPQEAALAAIMRPAIRYWLMHILGQVIDCTVAATNRHGLQPGSLFSRALAF